MLRFIREPIQVLTSGTTLPRHVHPYAYATLVLEGGYEEAGESGRWCVRAGQVLIHAPFSIHHNHSLHQGARLLNLRLPATTARSACGCVTNADLIIRLAGHDAQAATQALLEGWRMGGAALDEAPDRLASLLSDSDPVSIGAWSAAQGVARQTVFRGFRALYGVSPTRYRVEARARRAWRLILAGRQTLAEVAEEAGYADQAHMSREVKRLTGSTPGAWAVEARRTIRSRQGLGQGERLSP